MIPETLHIKRDKVIKEFERLKVPGVIKVTPVLPDKVNIRIDQGPVRREKTIHENEKSFLRQLMQFHGIL